MFPIYLKSGQRFKLSGSIYTILRNESNEKIQVLNESFNEMCFFTYKELIQNLTSGKLKFEVKGKNTKPSSNNDIKTSYSFNDLESSPYKNTIIYRRKIIESLLQIPESKRTRKDITDHVKNVNSLFEFPSRFKEHYGVEPLKKISASTVYRWIKFFNESGGDIRSLAPDYKNCGGKYKSRFNDKIQQFLVESVNERYLNMQRVTIKELFYDVVNRVTEYNELSNNILDYPSYSTIVRNVHKIPQYDLIAHRFGKRSAEKNYTPVGDGVKVTKPLERVEIDSTILDILLVDDSGKIIGRPYIVAAIDKFTRSILGFSIGFGSVGWPEVMQCIYHMLTDKSYVTQKYPDIINEWTAFGTPITLVIDNGLAFNNNPMADAALQLGFIVQQCPPKVPEWKGSIERFFGIANKGLIHQMPGTTRSNPQQLSEDENPSKQACLKFPIFIKLIHKWALDVYSQDFNKGVKAIPSKLWAKSMQDNLIPLPNDISEIAICLGRIAYRKVTRKGIELNNLRYNSDNLNKLLRKFSIENEGKNKKFKVKYNPLDLSEVFIYDDLIDKCWFRVPSTDLQYTKNLTEWEHKENVARALCEVGTVDIVALAKAKAQIYQEIQNNNSLSKKKTKIKKQNMASEVQAKPKASSKCNYNALDKTKHFEVWEQNTNKEKSDFDLGTVFVNTDISKTVVIPLDTLNNSDNKKDSIGTKKQIKNKLVDKTNIKPQNLSINKNSTIKNDNLTEEDFKGFKIIKT